MKREYIKINTEAGDNSFQRNLLFVDGTRDTTLGYTFDFGRVINIHPEIHSIFKKNIIKTSAHELGHSFKLEHVNTDIDVETLTQFGTTPTFGLSIAESSNNLMVSAGDNEKLFKKQWDKIQK